MEDLIKKIQKVPQLAIRPVKNGYIVSNFFSSHLGEMNKIQHEIMILADKVSCFGDVENVGILAENIQLDETGRGCVLQSSNHPVNSEFFLAPIRFAFFREK